MPEKWTCHEAWLETLDGRRLFSYADHPLHVVSYSLPFEGVVSREELLAHLHVHARLPDAVPFVFKYYERDWGLCCSRHSRDSLRDERYRVVIRTTFSSARSRSARSWSRARATTRSCSARISATRRMVNDDLTGVVVGLDVMRALRAEPARDTRTAC